MAMYAIQFAAQRRTEAPREDLTTLLLETDFDGTLHDRPRVRQLLRAARHRRQRHHEDDAVVGPARAARASRTSSPSCAPTRRCIPGAVEEILRYANPLHYFRRTATADTELRDVEIAAGDKVVMFYTSANRDEDVFDDPQRFDIRRIPNPHLSFGIAEHFCLGVHLARLEGRVFFEELLATFPTIELTGEPVRIRSNLNNAPEGAAGPPRRVSATR